MSETIIVKQKRSDLVQQEVDFGYEIEQPARARYQDGIYANPNPRGLPSGIPEAVRSRSVGNELHGHWDGSGPWEANLGHSPQLGVLLQNFNKWVGNDPWCWSNNYSGGSGCGSHFHISLVGDKRVAGQSFRTLEYDDYATAYNTIVTIQPFFTPFLCAGKQFRVSALEEWALPVIDRVTKNDMERLFNNQSIQGRLTGRHIGVGHEYSSPSLNRHEKDTLTIEIRLNEQHPYFAFPGMQWLASLIRGCIARGNSIKLASDEEYKRVMKSAWENIAEYGPYEGLLRTENITFMAERNIPGLLREGQEKTFETGLDLFRAICRRFKSSKEFSAVNYPKVMRMFSDFIALWKIPTHLWWNVDELYRLLYEDANAKANQDAWLAYGSKAVLPEDVRCSRKNSCKKLIHS